MADQFSLQEFALRVNEVGTYEKCFDTTHKNMVLQAARDGETQILDKFVRFSNGNINDVDGYMNTVLHYAAYFGHMNLLEYLLSEYDLDLNNPNHVGNTPFHLACEKAQFAVLERLLKAGVNANAQNIRNATGLQILCYLKRQGKHKSVDFQSCIDLLRKHPGTDLSPLG